MSPVVALSTCLRKYAEFRGRAARPEFWWWALAVSVVAVIASALDAAVGTLVYTVVWGLAILLPTLAAAVRRLRDAGHPWFWAILLVVPVFGLIAVVLLALPSLAPRTRPAA